MYCRVGLSSFPTTTTDASVFRSNSNVGAAPFDQVGNLVLMPRPTAGRSLDIVTGLSKTHTLRCQDGQVIMPNLPTSDPAIANALWNDGGTLKISSG